MQVTVKVSEPATKIAGGWTGMRPVGRVRNYSANVMGRDFTNTSKGEIQRVIRAAIHREEDRCGFLHVPVQFTFVAEEA